MDNLTQIPQGERFSTFLSPSPSLPPAPLRPEGSCKSYGVLSSRSASHFVLFTTLTM